jgi:hypothetical protein
LFRALEINDPGEPSVPSAALAFTIFVRSRRDFVPVRAVVDSAHSGAGRHRWSRRPSGGFASGGTVL